MVISSDDTESATPFEGELMVRYQEMGSTEVNNRSHGLLGAGRLACLKERK